MALVRSEGGLLPADVLARISALDRDLGGLSSEDFHLVKGERLGEAIARSWARLQPAWESFSEQLEALPEGDHAVALTRKAWLLPLFSELGFGRLSAQAGLEVAGKKYPVFAEWHNSPIHFVGAKMPLDRRTPGAAGAATQSPHSLVQEFLNRSSAHLWGVVSNGLTLRLLRDNLALTRQAYIEFDLAGIFSDEAYEDFALLWMICHQSRVEATNPEECWLEQWVQAAGRDGTRAMDQLRVGVEEAIEALGQGFLEQAANVDLQEALRDGSLQSIGYYRELLRMVYRLLFLFVAEDRDALLLPDDGSAERRQARDRFTRFYGTKRIRQLASRRRGGRAHDLYEQLKLLTDWLHEDGEELLALPPLGSALWDPSTTSHLSGSRLGNEALLRAVRSLAFADDGRRPIDFRNLGAEELGSVYESLLELHPEIDRETAGFQLRSAAGNERKQTGSYYTPSSLTASLLETALDPVLEEAARSDDPEAAILSLTVCDPAAGSGHFLIAAANRIAKRLAAIREQDPEPPPEAVRTALREVVANCIYGVDANPMAVELCKVSLWLEALEPGRPLSFLDHHIVCGNSLLGAIPQLLAEGIPDAAFTAITGDDKSACTELRRRNKREGKGQTELDLFAEADGEQIAELAAKTAELERLGGDSLDAVHEQEARFRDLVSSPEHEQAKLMADLWCAAFVAPKKKGSKGLTQASLDALARSGPSSLDSDVVDDLAGAVEEYNFLHWHVAFPAIFGYEGGGFSAVLGNPPWDHTELKEKEYFAVRAPEIAKASSGAIRKRMIDALAEDDPELFGAFIAAKRHADGVSHFVRNSGKYPLCGSGRINTYAIFAEAMRSQIRADGRVGVIVPTGIATDDTTKHFFDEIASSGALVSLFDFENRRRIFEGVHASYRFSLLTVAGSARPPGSPAEFAFFMLSTDDLLDPERRFELTAEDIALLNPNTKTCPIFRTRRDAEITKAIYRRFPVLIEQRETDVNPWGISFRQGLYNMTSDSASFRTRQQLEELGWELDGNVFVLGAKRMLPLYEGKMFHHFTHRWGSAADDADAAESGQAHYPTARYWVDETDAEERGAEPLLIGYRNIARTVDERTVICDLLPKAGAGNSVILVKVDPPAIEHKLLLLGLLSSFAFDYCARNKVGGTNMTYNYFRQFPAPAPDDIPPATAAQIRSLVSALLAVDPEMAELLEVSPVTDRAEVQDLRAELDGIVLALYGVTRDEAEHILDSFPIVNRKDMEQHEELMTKRLVLQAFDRAAGSMPAVAEAG